MAIERLSYRRNGLTKGEAAAVIVIRMSDATHLDAPGPIRRFLEGPLFYLVVLAALAVLIFLAGVILGVVPVSETA